MSEPDNLYRREADFLLRENMNKLKGLIDLLALGILDTMEASEKDVFIEKIKSHMDQLYQKLDASITKDS